MAAGYLHHFHTMDEETAAFLFMQTEEYEVMLMMKITKPPTLLQHFLSQEGMSDDVCTT